MFAVTAGDVRHKAIIGLWEERAIACGLTPVIYDLGGLGRGELFTTAMLTKMPPLMEQAILRGGMTIIPPSPIKIIEKALDDLEGHFVFTEPDCVFRGFPSKLVGDWAVGVTVNPKAKWDAEGRIDPAVLYFSDGPDCRDFIAAWKALVDKDVTDAQALSVLLPDIKRGGHVTVYGPNHQVKVQAFPREIYNCRSDEDVRRAVVVNLANEEWAAATTDELAGKCSLTHGPIKTGGVYERFVDDGTYDLGRFVREADAPPPPSNVVPGVYEGHPEAVIVACFFNPQRNPYRLIAFHKWFRSIKHLNFRIVECLIGEDAVPQLPAHPHITQVRADDLIWHKETLLNMAVADLPPEFRYVFIIDADVLFTSPHWLTDSVKALNTVGVVQPFEFCVHLEKNRLEPAFVTAACEADVDDPVKREKSMWRSFAANIAESSLAGSSNNYDVHGHVGFAWGFRREVLDACPLFEKALIGGADHILAHAAAGQIPHPCIAKSFTADLAAVLEWSKRFSEACGFGHPRLGFAPGYLYHIWHGDLAKRDYLQRIREFTGTSREFQKGPNGLYKMPPQNRQYVNRYYRDREVGYSEFDFGFDPTFAEDMGYMLFDLLNLFGPARFNDEVVPMDYPPDQGGVVDLPWDQPGVGVPPPENDPGVLPWDVPGAGQLPPDINLEPAPAAGIDLQPAPDYPPNDVAPDGPVDPTDSSTFS